MIKKNIIKNNLISHGSSSLKGIITPPGDKSISHRALLFSSLALGKSEISNLLHSEDVLNMVKALKLLGIKITKINNITTNKSDIVKPKFSISGKESEIFITATNGNFLSEEKILLEDNVKFKSKDFTDCKIFL